MEARLQCILESHHHHSKQASRIATFEAPDDHDFMVLLGASPNKKSLVKESVLPPKGFPPQHTFSDETFEDISVVSHLNLLELISVYQQWKSLHRKTERLSSIEMIISCMHSFTVHDWGSPQLVYFIYE